MAEVVVLLLLSVALGFLILYIFSLFGASFSRRPRKVISKKELQNNRIKYFADLRKESDEENSVVKETSTNIIDNNAPHHCASLTSAENKPQLILERDNTDTNIDASNKNTQITVNLSSSLCRADHNTSQPVTKPIKTLDELLTWLPGFDEFSVARIPIRFVVNDGKPKTLVCHDMKGGYIEDRYCQGYLSDKCYHLQCWNLIDSFCYFSHNFVTIPPPCWTNAAHTNGVKSLGTIITEWDDGEKMWEEILSSEEQIKRLVQQLVRITEYYRFDGWLVNIENKIAPVQVESVLSFLTLLTDNLHEQIPGSQVIWYDSVINTGELAWQNKLCSVNRIFFDVCDGIFLNYNWSIHDLQESIYLSGAERQKDVFVGVDVFGRGCFGGGGWNSYKAMQVIRDKGLSAAIFAPGWVMEKFGEDDFPKNNQKFWELLTSYLYPHYISDLPLVSSFCRGYGKQVFQNGQKLSSEPWTNLSTQSLQPTFSSSFYQLGPKSGMLVENMEYCVTDGFNGGGCIQIDGTIKPEKEQTRTVFRFFKTDITMKREKYFVSYTFKTSSQHVQLFLLFIFKDHPTYMVFSPNKKNVIEEIDTSYTLPEEQEHNYTILEQNVHVEDSKEDINEWTTRNFVFTMANSRVLQEVRFACTTGGISTEVEKQSFTMRIGEIKISRSTDIRSSIPRPINIRCRNVSITAYDEDNKRISFILSWDYKVNNEKRAPKCYDIFCEGVCDQVNLVGAAENLQMDGGKKFIGRAYADSYYVNGLVVPKSCVGSLLFTVQSVGLNDVMLPLDQCGSVSIKY